MGNVIVSCASGADSAENVTVAYQTAGAALEAGREVVMWLSVDGVRLAEAEYADGIQSIGAPPVSELHKRFVAAGGRFYVCPTCWSARDLDDGRLVPGAELRDAGALFEFAGDDAITFSY